VKGLARAEKPGNQVNQEPVDCDYQTGDGNQSEYDALDLVGMADLLYAKVHESHSEHDFNQFQHC